MPVVFHEASGTFHLYNESVSYIIHIMENGELENFYYGKRVHDRENYSYLREPIRKWMSCICVPETPEEPSDLSLEYIKQEYPSYGTSDFRNPAMEILQQNGSRIVHFTYVSHEIMQGKSKPEGMPATYVEDPDEATTLVILMHDEVMDTDLRLFYSIYRDYPVITRRAEFSQRGEESICIERAMSTCVEFKNKDYDLIQLSGAWARERYINRRPLERGITAVETMHGGCSGGEFNPFLALVSKDATETNGSVYGFSLVYSGNFLAQAEVSTFDLTRIIMGINPRNFSWELKKGETFATPECVMVYSSEGIGRMSRVYQKLYRTRLSRGYWRDRPRPILLNNWEATEMSFDEEKILSIARKAAEVGAELFVLDDGWFGTRNNDWQGLGDWYANTDKLPGGIPGLAKKVEAMGLKFGLWVELEMVNKNSDLYRAHPDWILATPGRFASTGRHQHILDFSKKEVRDAIYDQIVKILRSAPISYIKWDHNRYMTEAFSIGGTAADQGKVMHRYILGLYDLYDRLTSEFPEILFESCASGGARFDPAMLYYAPQAWCSDDTDGAERVKIQYGTSLVYPTVSMGAHVSMVPNKQLSRCTPLDTRANVAYFGTFGYELDLNLLSDEEIEKVKKQIAFMKEYRELIQMDGEFYRLRDPFTGNVAAWITVSTDRTQAVAMYFQMLNEVNAPYLRLKLQGLDRDLLYHVQWDAGSNTRKLDAYGDELMNIGIPIEREDLTAQGADFASLLFEVSGTGDGSVSHFRR